MIVLAEHGALAGAPLSDRLRDLVAVAATVGFGTKAGAIPLPAPSRRPTGRCARRR